MKLKIKEKIILDLKHQNIIAALNQKIEKIEKDNKEIKESIEVKTKPKKANKLTKQQQIEIDQIKEMFDIGALTKDEYDAAIKRALN